MKSPAMKLQIFAFLALLVVSSSSGQKCTRGGFFRHPEDCTRFYRCVDLTGAGFYRKYTFACPAGTVFDENVSVCNWPWAAAPCEDEAEEEEEDNDNSVIVSPTFDYTCPAKGIYAHDSDCARFWLCKGGENKPELYKCPGGYLFSDAVLRCQKEEEVECDKVPDTLRIRAEPTPITLRISELDAFFSRWSNF